ncbi:MAG TPA: HAMP domain-containing protein [Thermodesulfobacteriota bacterium]|nr:HAMP domain-containing protein [Thermodesulfobacteriota bacterium]
MTEITKREGSFPDRTTGPFRQRMNRLGLKGTLLLGIFIPILIAFLIIAGLLFVNVGPWVSIQALGSNSLKELGEASVRESVASLNKLGEKIIQEKAEGVARQIEIYLETHPGLPEAALANQARLQEIAIQRVGETGYTAVHNNKGINYFHINPKIVGTDLNKLAAKLPDFVKVMEAGLKGASGGYYQWTDIDGKIRPKYMFSAPVEGTNLIVAATTYIDEFGKPAGAILAKVDRMQAAYAERYRSRFLIFLAIVLIDLAVLLAVIYAFSSSLVRPIRQLSEAADRISMGDLEAAVNVEGEGEVARLGQSIERMRTSVKTALERLESRKPITIRK